MRRAFIAVAAAAAVAMALIPAAAQAYEPCPSDPVQPWMGTSEGAQIAVPSLSQPDGIASYDGTIFRPADSAAFPGPRPLVVLQHGLGGRQCAQHWTARTLAGHGYTSMIWTAPEGASTTASFINAMDATRSALAFARSPSNPYATQTDVSRIVLAGHSLGSVTSSRLQGIGEPGVVGVVALDTLRRYTSGDQGGAEGECIQTPTGEVTPTVPALGFAMDQPCNANPGFAPDDLKLAGFAHWRAAGVPVVQLVMRGFIHSSFSIRGTDTEHQLVSRFWLDWMRLFVDGDASARKDLLAPVVNGVPTPSLLSERFRSAAYLPPDIDTDDLAGFLADTKAPNTKAKGRKRPGKVRRNDLVELRFKANEPATFECRRDRRKWKRCTSPQRVRTKKLGRHSFEVRATDVLGNRESKPLRWKYEVVGG